MRAFGRALGDLFGFFGRTIWRFMVIFSFIVNLVLVVIVAVLGILIFNIKNDVADPLLKGLHSSFVGLDDATIDWTIPVRDSVDAKFTLPLNQNTVVVLTEDVPLRVLANISGPVSIQNATVALTLPEGLNLPVALNLDVPVDEKIPVNLDVRAVIPLSDTQLHDPFENLKLTFEPIILALDNMPNSFGEASVFVNGILAGQPVDLFEESEYVQNPWTGFSRTAGIGYDLLDESRRLNTPVQSGVSASSSDSTNAAPANVFLTGIQVKGGIPALDTMVRPELYENQGSPGQSIDEARAALEAQNIPAESYTGDFANLQLIPESNSSDSSVQGSTGTDIGGPTSSDDVIVPEEPQPVFTVMPDTGS